MDNPIDRLPLYNHGIRQVSYFVRRPELGKQMSLNLSSWNEIPVEEQAYLRTRLQPDEQVLWTGRPSGWRSTLSYVFGTSLMLLVPFGVVWMSINSLVFVSMLRDERQHRLTEFLIAAIFMLIGIALLSTPIWLIRQWRSTYYLLTNRRAAVLRRFGKNRWHILNFTPEECRRVTCDERSDGKGDLIFREYLRQVPRHRCGFLDIENVREVEELVYRAFRSAS